MKVENTGIPVRLQMDEPKNCSAGACIAKNFLLMGRDTFKKTGLQLALLFLLHWQIFYDKTDEECTTWTNE